MALTVASISAAPTGAWLCDLNGSDIVPVIAWGTTTTPAGNIVTPIIIDPISGLAEAPDSYDAILPGPVGPLSRKDRFAISAVGGLTANEDFVERMASLRANQPGLDTDPIVAEIVYLLAVAMEAEAVANE